MAYRSHLRKVGGSVMLAIPKPVAEALDLSADSAVDLSVYAGKLVIEPHVRPRYSLDELLAQCNRSGRVSIEDREWTSDRARGRELI